MLCKAGTDSVSLSVCLCVCLCKSWTEIDETW